MQVPVQVAVLVTAIDIRAQETKTFPVSGAPRVNIGTFDGSIVVHGWDRPEVMYTATKRSEEEET